MRWVIFSDLDGTFLDETNYSYQPSRPFVAKLVEAGIPIVFCSSKTRVEIHHLRQELGIRDPFIAENGAILCMEKDYFPFSFEHQGERDGLYTIELGEPHGLLVTALHQAKSRAGCEIGEFSKLTPEEMQKITGLPADQIWMAQKREFDEPFWFITEDPAIRKKFLKEVRRQGLRITHGNRFYHIKGRADKGRAVSIMKSLFQRGWQNLKFIGLGDSLNDLPMLRAVDFPILLRGSDGQWNREILAAIPKVLAAPASAPHGWGASILPLVVGDLRYGSKEEMDRMVDDVMLEEGLH